jgi:hypothetical protein
MKTIPVLVLASIVDPNVTDPEHELTVPVVHLVRGARTGKAARVTHTIAICGRKKSANRIWKAEAEYTRDTYDDVTCDRCKERGPRVRL